MMPPPSLEWDYLTRAAGALRMLYTPALWAVLRRAAWMPSLQPQREGYLFPLFCCQFTLSRRVCPWKAFCLGETVSLLLLFHVKLILMQHLLIQKHSVLQAKRKALLCQISTSGQVVKCCNYFASTFLFDRTYVSALCRGAIRFDWSSCFKK